jgi:hypothetical protein
VGPFYSYALTGFLWDVLYSPFGSVNRIWAAFYILMAYFVLKSSAAKDLEIRQHKITLLAADRKVRIRLPGRIAASRVPF